MLATLTTAALITVSPMLWGSEGNNEENFFIKTATGTPAAETDFTEAAKNTIEHRRQKQISRKRQKTRLTVLSA